MGSSSEFGRGRRTSYLDRTWLNRWTVLTLTPIHGPNVDELRTKMVEFMASNPHHPLSCTLEEGGKRWRPVASHDRGRHVMETIVPGGPYYLDDPFTYLNENRPDPASTAPFKVMVGPESITFYFLHTVGDAVIFSPFSVRMAFGDVEGLLPLNADAGLGVAMRILLKETRPHWRDWWSHMRSSAPAENPNDLVARTSAPSLGTTATGTLVTAAEFDAFTKWRKSTRPDVSATALMAAAAYRALAAEGVPINSAGFNTLIDLRRHLPKEQAMRPGNLAKGVFISADMADPAAVGEGLKQLVSTARAVPALFSGALAAVLRTPKPSAGVCGAGPVTMTFNSMMRNPGVDEIPWIDPKEARYLTMSYSDESDGISVAACAVQGRVFFSASFSPDQVNAKAVARALDRLRDMPALFESRQPESEDLLVSATVERIPSPVAGNVAR